VAIPKNDGSVHEGFGLLRGEAYAMEDLEIFLHAFHVCLCHGAKHVGRTRGLLLLPFGHSTPGCLAGVKLEYLQR
jgi:hypothetical protein